MAFRIKIESVCGVWQEVVEGGAAVRGFRLNNERDGGHVSGKVRVG